MQEEQEARRSERHKRPAANVISEEITVDEIKREEAYHEIVASGN